MMDTTSACPDRLEHCWACKAEELFKLMNPDRYTITCVGYAPSQGRRCRNPIARHNLDYALEICDRVGKGIESREDRERLLLEMADRLLCVRYHRNQAEAVASKWITMLKINAQRVREENDKVHAAQEITIRQNANLQREDEWHVQMLAAAEAIEDPVDDDSGYHSAAMDELCSDDEAEKDPAPPDPASAPTDQFESAANSSCNMLQPYNTDQQLTEQISQDMVQVHIELHTAVEIHLHHDSGQSYEPAHMPDPTTVATIASELGCNPLDFPPTVPDEPFALVCEVATGSLKESPMIAGSADSMSANDTVQEDINETVSAGVPVLELHQAELIENQALNPPAVCDDTTMPPPAAHKKQVSAVSRPCRRLEDMFTYLNNPHAQVAVGLAAYVAVWLLSD